MAVSYGVSKTGTSLQVSYRATGPAPPFGIYTYTQNNGFLPFDLSAEGISAGSILTAQLILYCTVLIGGTHNVRLYSATGASGFGATLDATEADFISTQVNLEDTQSMASTGLKTFTLDPSHIDTSGVTYLKLKDANAGAPATIFTSVQYSTSESSSNKPILRLTLASGRIVFVNRMRNA